MCESCFCPICKDFSLTELSQYIKKLAGSGRRISTRGRISWLTKSSELSPVHTRLYGRVLLYVYNWRNITFWVWPFILFLIYRFLSFICMIVYFITSMTQWLIRCHGLTVLAIFFFGIVFIVIAISPCAI